MKILKTVICTLALASSAWVQANDLPPAPVRILVGFAPGGGNDVVARLISTPLQARLQSTVIVENKPGAGSTIANAEMAKAPATGQTLLLGSTGSQAIAPHLYKQLPYDPIKNIQPVSLVSKSVVAIVVNSGLPIHNVRDLLNFAKANPGKLNFASPGNGTGTHLAGELFKSMAKVQMTHVPYRGDAPAMQDVMAGASQLMFASLPAAIAAGQSGRVRVIAVSGPKRVNSLPDVPTVTESGLPGYEVETWYGIFTTGGTPMPVVQRLSREIGEVLTSPSVRESIQKMGMEIAPSTPDELAKLVTAEMTRWGKVIQDAGIRID